MLFFVLATAVLLAVLLAAEYGAYHTLKCISKSLASACFVGLAVWAGAFHTGYGRIVFAALLLCAIGDMLLIPRSRKFFVWGLFAFLLGHLSYAFAFSGRLQSWEWAAGGLGGLLAVSMVLLPWLRPNVPGKMWTPVVAYIAVISLMVVMAAGTGEKLILAGAVAFYLSDVAVARQRFVAPGLENKVWGLPLYYAAQLMLASSVGGP